jgi:uncharacterized protein YndB with AHSA1/START domain
MERLKVSAIIQVPINKVWQFWTKAEHVKGWNFASSDWHCPNATIHLYIDGEFHYTMAAKDASASFDFWGIYKKIEKEKFIDIVLGDGRKMSVSFEKINNSTKIIEEFESETENSIELQQTGWQMILDNFKKYCELNSENL